MVVVKYDARVQTPPLCSAFISFNKTLSLVSDAVECVGCYLDELQMHLCVTSMHTCFYNISARGTYPWVVCLMLRISCILCSSLSFKCRRKGLCCMHMHNAKCKMCPAAEMWNRIEPFGKVHACLHYLSDPPRCISLVAHSIFQSLRRLRHALLQMQICFFT